VNEPTDELLLEMSFVTPDADDVVAAVRHVMK
jgi:hypothetical protein